MVIFAIIVDRLKFVGLADFGGNCFITAKTSCHTTKDDWMVKHMLDSIEEFWGSSLACFILGGYVVAAAVYLYNNPDASKDKPQ